MIYLTGDTHNYLDIGRLSFHNFDDGRRLTKKDYVIILGDFGFPWADPPSKEEVYWRKWLNDKPWTTLFIDGNHDNFHLLNHLGDIPMFGSEVGILETSIFHLRRGYVYTIDDKKFFTFGGGYSIDKHNRTPGLNWWPEEMPNNLEYELGLDNLHKHNGEVDYILTHTCGHRNFHRFAAKEGLIPGIRNEDELRHYFDKVEEIVQYKHWYCGHYHREHSHEKFTTMYHSIKKLEG